MKKVFWTKFLKLILLALFLFLPAASRASNPFFTITKGWRQDFNRLLTGIGEKATSKTNTEGIYSFINRCSGDIFVGNNSATEFQSFLNNPPACVERNECGDGVCQSSTENTTNCTDDCYRPSGYCGDGICQTDNGVQVYVSYNPPKESTYWEKTCREKTNRWIWVPVVNTVLVWTGNITHMVCDDVKKTVKIYGGYVDGGEAYTVTDYYKQTECKQDCAPPSTAGCGTCGYNTSGQLCPNYCGDKGYNLVNCSYKAPVTYTECKGENPAPALIKNNTLPYLKKYFSVASALAYVEPGPSDCITYTDGGYYTCSNTDAASLCPAGYYCTNAGGLNTSFCPSGKTCQQITCPAGSFCPQGSSYPRYCAYNYYSNAGASSCTACPTGTGTATGGSAGLSSCQAVNIANDGVCGPSENPTNSPQDCPDNFSDSRQSAWVGDGLCTGIETMANSLDCSCGNGVCDTNESDLLCAADCGCLDNICAAGETNKCMVGGVARTNPGCSTLANTDRCGDGVCSAGESYNTTLGKIVCKADCFCGDGKCESTRGETMANCSRDCSCGNGICDGNDTMYNCIQDCSCGNGKCESQYGENWRNCLGDCSCGNGLCEYNETPSSCYLDCSVCGNGVCEFRETIIKPVPAGKVYCYNDCSDTTTDPLDPICLPGKPCSLDPSLE